MSHFAFSDISANHHLSVHDDEIVYQWFFGETAQQPKLKFFSRHLLSEGREKIFGPMEEVRCYMQLEK